MKDIFHIDQSQWIVMGVFLLVGGLIVLLMIDFLWGTFCLGGAFWCFWRVPDSSEKNIAPNEGLIEDD